jgi:UDP-N-acetylglucosamine 2-epimerase (non-hydrolysing)
MRLPRIGPHVMCVVGTRPNFMKIKPIVDALGRRQIPTTLIHTGQHHDETMSDVFFEDLGLRRPDIDLGVGSGTHAEQVGAVMVGIERLLDRYHPDVVVVVGDVNSTLGAALAVAKAPSLLAHVEAGFRSGDWTMPEEVNRVVTDRLSDLLFAATPAAVENLLDEGMRSDRVHLVGDVMAETLLRFLDEARQRPILKELGIEPREYGLITLHRPSNVDDRESLAGLLEALEILAGDLTMVLPVHPRTKLRMRDHRLRIPAGVRAVPPLGYLDFVALEAAARLILTDSGSVQEEAHVLGVPCLTLRDTTERPETVTQGANRLVGRDPGRIVASARMVLDRPPEAPPLPPVEPVGERIVEVLVRLGR